MTDRVDALLPDGRPVGRRADGRYEPAPYAPRGQGALLLRAVLIDPGDDLARLAYADRLEEEGGIERASRAAFIRDGVAICHPERLNPDHDMGADWDGVIDIVTQYPPPGGPGHCPLCAAITRQRLLPWPKVIAYDVAGRVGSEWPDWSGRKGPSGNYVGVRCRGGFAHGVSLTCKQFMGGAQALFSAHPITEVTLTDRSVAWGRYEPPGRFGVVRRSEMKEDAPFALPDELFPFLIEQGGVSDPDRHLRGWLYWPAPKGLAERAISAACVAYGRWLAGLPALTMASTSAPPRP